MRARTILAMLPLLGTAAVGASGCARDNLTPATPQASPTPGPVPACIPNLDGVITADEMQPAIGVAAHFDVTTGEHSIDVAQTQSASGGAPGWDWSWSAASDAGFDLVGSDMASKWYAPYFPGAQFAAPIDTADTTEGIYKKDDTAVWLMGVASTEEQPANGKTLLIYQQPIALYKFPLQVGASWTSTGTVTNGTLYGLAYAGYDTYDVSVDASGELDLPDFTFQQVLRVRTNVTVQPSVGYTSTRKLVGFFFECYGEVARATSDLNETQDDFTSASEVRRLGLPPQGGHS